MLKNYTSNNKSPYVGTGQYSWSTIISSSSIGARSSDIAVNTTSLKNVACSCPSSLEAASAVTFLSSASAFCALARREEHLARSSFCTDTSASAYADCTLFIESARLVI